MFVALNKINAFGKEIYMDLTNSVFSDDYFFKFGFETLLAQAPVEENYHIIDVETMDYSQVTESVCLGKTVFAFIVNDIDYYALQHLENVTLIDRRSTIKEVLSCLLLKSSRCNYQVKYKLSVRENEVLTCMQQGLDTPEISQRLGMNMKTFYAHRTRMISKLQIGNRITLYKNIAKHRALA
jgi:DNA-binding CsgD family transcriptional regulator